MSDCIQCDIYGDLKLASQVSQPDKQQSHVSYSYSKSKSTKTKMLEKCIRNAIWESNKEYWVLITSQNEYPHTDMST
jgi:hypothetical protein